MFFFDLNYLRSVSLSYVVKHKKRLWLININVMRPDLPPHRRPVNTVFQKYALFPHLNVFDNIAFCLKLKNIPKDTIVQKVKNALRMVNYSPQAIAACPVATAAMWLLTDFIFASRLRLVKIQYRQFF